MGSLKSLAIWFVCVLMSAVHMTQAQEAGGTPVAPPAEGLSAEQVQVADRFKKLEDLLLRSAELEAVENPTRSALLQQAAQLGKQSQLADLLARAADRLEKKQFSQAIEDQKTSRDNLKRLLELLQSENRGERVREQRDQVRRWIEETDRLLRLQKSLSGRTEGGQEMEQAAGDQSKLADKAAEIASDLSGDKEEKPKTGTPEKSGDKSQPNSDKKSGEEPSAAGDDAEPKDDTPSKESQDGRPKDEPKKDASGKGGDQKGDSQKSDTDEKDPMPPKSEGSDKSSEKNGESSKESKDGKAESSDSESKKSESKKSESKKSESKKSESKKSESNESSESEQGKKPNDQPSGEPQQGESSKGQPQQGESPQGEPQQGSAQQSEAQPPEPKDPTERAKQRIERAQQKMKEAQESLKEAQRKGAVEKQREAEDELRAAIEELEEILRQLREEEIERSLASLETRLRRMLEMQTKVLEETNRLQEITGEQATRQVEIRASNLALEERKILAEGERAFLLLREEGSSAAFPEAIEQVNTDIGNVAERLAKADIGKLTTTIEQEIVSSLEEMVAALAQIQKEKKEKKEQQQQQQQQQGEPGDQPLVDKLAELRLIRTLQIRINKRTDALSKMLDDPADVVGQVKEVEILGEVRGLAERQSSIEKVTRDIVVGADQ